MEEHAFGFRPVVNENFLSQTFVDSWFIEFLCIPVVKDCLEVLVVLIFMLAVDSPWFLLEVGVRRDFMHFIGPLSIGILYVLVTVFQSNLVSIDSFGPKWCSNLLLSLAWKFHEIVDIVCKVFIGSIALRNFVFKFDITQGVKPSRDEECWSHLILLIRSHLPLKRCKHFYYYNIST